MTCEQNIFIVSFPVKIKLALAVSLSKTKEFVIHKNVKNIISISVISNTECDIPFEIQYTI